jgi:hypothetical protein
MRSKSLSAGPKALVKSVNSGATSGFSFLEHWFITYPSATQGEMMGELVAELSWEWVSNLRFYGK